MYHNSLFLKFDLVENTEKHRRRMFYGTKVIFCLWQKYVWNCSGLTIASLKHALRSLTP